MSASNEIPAGDTGGAVTAPRSGMAVSRAPAGANSGAASLPCVAAPVFSAARALWQEHEDAILADYIVKRRLSASAARKIAEQIGRSADAVQKRLTKLRADAAGKRRQRIRGYHAATTGAERALIVRMYEEGAKVREIMAETGRTQGTIYKVIQAYREDPDTLNDANMIVRKCAMCRVEFKQDRSKTNWWRCDAHRSVSDDWMSENSVGGRVRSVR